MTEQQNITLEDIENMIQVLEQFIKLSRRAERIVRHLAPSRSSGREDFMQTFMKEAMNRREGGGGGLLSGQAGEYEEVELDEDTRATIEKLRKRKEQQASAQK